MVEKELLNVNESFYLQKGKQKELNQGRKGLESHKNTIGHRREGFFQELTMPQIQRGRDFHLISISGKRFKGRKRFDKYF